MTKLEELKAAADAAYDAFAAANAAAWCAAEDTYNSACDAIDIADAAYVDARATRDAYEKELDRCQKQLKK